jgi:hypothetical protein
MSWFRNIPDKAFYLLVEPELYYEWEHMGSIPNNTKFRYGNIRNIKTLDKVAISVESADIVAKEKEYLSINNIPITCARFVSGSVKNKDEIRSIYMELKGRLRREFVLFKEAMINRGYFIKEGTLYCLKAENEDEVLLKNYGKWENIIEKAKKAQASMGVPKRPGNMKSIDLIDLHTLTNILTQLSYNVPFDNNKMITLLKNSNQEATSQNKKKWMDIYCEIDKNALTIKNKIDRFEKLSWLKVVQT